MTRHLTKHWLARTASVLLLAAAAVIALPPAKQVFGADPKNDPKNAAVTAQTGARFLPLGIGKSVVIDLPRDIKDVLVADPKIANAVVRSAQRAYIIGAAVGQTNIFFFDNDGQQIAAYDIAVTRDLNGVRAALKQSFPNADVHIEGVGDGVMLSGVVSSPADAQQINEIASRLVGDPGKVVSSIVVRGRDQVMLKVTVAEVQRDVIKQLGVDLSGSMNIGSSVVNFNNVNPFPVNGSALVPGNQIAGSFPTGTNQSITATMRAMERAGIVRTLAEPNLTAISGEAATFIAGGEFPIPSGVTCQNGGAGPCQPSITFKKFGISLNFTPVVLTEGRISLRVMTEVSEISNDNAININSLFIPSIKTRRADTTLEIPSGGSLAMAGLIQEQTKQSISGLPGLLQVPVLGPLFKSRDYINRQTELVVLVTPYVVRAVAQKDLSKPDDGFMDSSDPSTVISGTLNRVYGSPGGRPQPKQHRSLLGFITD